MVFTHPCGTEVTRGKAKFWDTSLEDILQLHGQSHITHIQWNHSGSYFASIDEKGKLVIWTNKRYLNSWAPVYWAEIYTPVICCEWINPERMYVASKAEGPTKYERERTGRPRSPLALVVLTSDGQLTTLFKPAGQIFTHISTNLPRRSVTEDLASSRITHGSMLSGADGIHLVTHVSNTLPSTVNLYQIDLRFTPEAMFRCEAVAILHIMNPLTGPGSVMIPGSVLHLKLLPQTSTKPISVAVALGAREEHSNGEITYKSQVAVWDITPQLMGFHPAFQELSTRRNDAVSGQPVMTFVFLGERRFESKFISALACVSRNRELVVGFSDGSILGLESRYIGLLDSTRTLLDGFQTEKSDSPIIAIAPSPNGFTLLCSSLNERISSVETSESSGYDLDLEASIQYAVVALLNEWDYSDIVAVVVKAFRTSNDDQVPDRLLEGIFRSYEAIKGAEDSSSIEPFMPKASVMRRMLAFQLVLCQALPHKIVQYRATCALLHLQSIGEVFSGCCTSDPATLAAHLEQGSNAGTGQKPLIFDANSLWSLFPLCGWVLDFCTVLFRELATFLTMKTAEPQGTSSVVPQNSTSTTAGALKPTLLCFFYHSRSRKTLRSVLTLVDQYYHYVKTVALATREARIVKLFSHVEATFTRCPIKPGAAMSMLRELNGVGGQPDGTRASGALDKTASDHLVFIKGTIPPNLTNPQVPAKVELKRIAQRCSILLWDVNRLLFATIHWLDLEPSNTLVGSKATPEQRIAAMHPSRCRMDPATVLKARALVGRLPYPNHHHSPNAGLGGMSAGPRGSISNASGRPGITSKVFPESSGDLALSQPLNPQLRTQTMPQSFGETSAAAATGMASRGDALDLNISSTSGSLSIWGLAFDDGDDYHGTHHQDNKDDEVETVKSVWTNWSPSLRGQLHGATASSRNPNSSEDNRAEMVPDGDMIEEEGDDEDDDRDSDEDMKDATIGGALGKGDRRSSLATTLTPSALWLLQESKAITKRTRLDWTVFPILSDERSYTGMGDSSSRMMEALGLSGHFAPVDLQPTEFNAHSQADIEAQVRKRRFGIDPIRKVKKYKTTGNGRRCIRAGNAQKRVLPHQIGTSPTVIPDIAANTLWYHNYDRSCICGGMWLEL
ncbi:mediator complex subunit [Mortierella sp. NVP85]|nr:mediator complex subunit [Mortierella sp. NVP85]